MNTKELCRFIVEAKTKTYASGADGEILKDGSKELTYREGSHLYRDRYFGDNPFIGEEIVFHEGKYTWGMNYYGLCFQGNDRISPKEVYAFLREALKLVSEDNPFRGPEKYEKGSMTYVNSLEGDASRFNGIEKILHKGKEVYRLLYHGGHAKSET